MVLRREPDTQSSRTLRERLRNGTEALSNSPGREVSRRVVHQGVNSASLRNHLITTAYATSPLEPIV